MEYDFTDRRCELTSALIDAFCGVENGERLFDEVRACVCSFGSSFRRCEDESGDDDDDDDEFVFFFLPSFGFCSSSSTRLTFFN